MQNFKGVIKLNLGCGKDIREGYINIDIRPLPGVVQADVLNLPIKDGSVAEILASDVYEHVSYHKSQELLAHWVSKLKRGGILIIRTPCLDKIVEFCGRAEALGTIEEIIAAIFGGQDYQENTHLTICQVALMKKYLRGAGIKGLMQYRFENVNVVWRCRK